MGMSLSHTKYSFLISVSLTQTTSIQRRYPFFLDELSLLSGIVPSSVAFTHLDVCLWCLQCKFLLCIRAKWDIVKGHPDDRKMLQ